MADENHTDTADKPLANLADAERGMNSDLLKPIAETQPRDASKPDRSDADIAAGKAAMQQARDRSMADRGEAMREQEAADEPELTGARGRLRAFEDATFGKDAVRINGLVERGYGSKFKEMSAEQALHYAALEKLIVAEQRLADAHGALIAAESSHEAALAEADKTEANIDAPADK